MKMQFKPLTGEDDPRVIAFLEAWHENGRIGWTYSFDYDEDQRKSAHDRKKYICLDCGTSGVFMAEKKTGDVYGIKGYGRIHRGHPVGNIVTATTAYRLATTQSLSLRTLLKG